MSISRRFLFLLFFCPVYLLGQRSGFVDAPSGKLYYEEKGKGEGIILVGRGAFMDSRQWEGLFHFLSSSYRVLRYDPTGFGKSDLPSAPYTNARDLKFLCDELKIERAILIGVSFGGGISMEVAIEFPSLVKALVLSAPAVSGSEISPDLQKQFGAFAEARAKSPDSLIQAVLRDENFIPAAKKNKKLELQFRSIMKDNLRPINLELAIDPGYTIVERAKDIKAPVLFIIGQRDHPGLHRQTRQLQRLIQHSSIEVLEGSGHVPHMETPDTFNTLVLKYLQNLSKQ